MFLFVAAFFFLFIFLALRLSISLSLSLSRLYDSKLQALSWHRTQPTSDIEKYVRGHPLPPLASLLVQIAPTAGHDVSVFLLLRLDLVLACGMWHVAARQHEGDS